MKTTIAHPMTLFDFLLGQYPDSPKTRIKKLLQSGSVRCNDQVVTHHAFRLDTGDRVEIRVPSGAAVRPLLPFPVLFEDPHVIVVDKPVGIVTSSPDDIVSVQWVITQSLKRFGRGSMRAWVVHRLDKEVSGALLFAKTKAVMNDIKDHWRETQKRYFALVEGTPRQPSGTIESRLIEDRSQKVRSTLQTEGAKQAITHYRTIKPVGAWTLLEVTLETGRKNQIRVHLSELGCPIVGDRKYGASGQFVRRIRLHAHYLRFPHPVTGETITVQSPMPGGFLTLKEKDEHYKR